VVQGDWIFVSGSTGFDCTTMQISPRVEDQARQCLENIQAALLDARMLIEIEVTAMRMR
jgi:enamine deaminase RidA (YjgF/YER057c/UK114 family)